MSLQDWCKTWMIIRHASEFARSIGFIADPWQERLLESDADRIVMCCGRQTGKSITAAVLARWVAETKPGSLVLILAPAFRQSMELLRKVRGFPFAQDAPMRVRDNLMSVEFDNGSRIIGLPGKDETVRSFSSVALLVADEAAYIPDRVFAGVTPMLAVSRGRMVLLSSPRMKSGYYHDVWANGEDWERYRVTSSECPRITDAFLAQERKRLPAFVYQREYEARFTDSNLALIAGDDIQAARSSDVTPLFGPGITRDVSPMIDIIDSRVEPLVVVAR